jgi:hypothetical protein
MPDRLRGAETEAEQGFLGLQPPMLLGGEETGTPLVVQEQEDAEADGKSGRSSALMARKRTSCLYVDRYEWV